MDSSSFVLKPSSLWRHSPLLLERMQEAGMARVSAGDVLAAANRQARPLATDEPPLRDLQPPVAAGFGWDAEDSASERWYPQGITTDGEGTLLVSWALEGRKAVRVSFVNSGEAGEGRYRHVLLVEPVTRWRAPGFGLEQIPLHAGGIACHGGLLFVADTLRGVRAFDMRAIFEVAEPERPLGYRYVMPQVGAYNLPILRSIWNRGPRFSFVSLSSGPTLLSGEYRRGKPGARIVSWELPEAAERRPLGAQDVFVSERTNLQGALRIDGRLLLASSVGTGKAGRLAIYRDGSAEPVLHPWVVGPESLAHDRGRDLVLSLTEHPHDEAERPRGGRVVFGVQASSL